MTAANTVMGIKASRSMPASPRMIGFTTPIWAKVKKVVILSITSCRTLVDHLL